MQSGKIEPGLFKLIQGLGATIEYLHRRIQMGGELSEVDQLRLAGVRDNLVAFIKNFMIQFFLEGFGFKVESLSTDTYALLLNAFPNSQDSIGAQAEPVVMVDCFGTYLRISKDIMANRYDLKVDDIRSAYCGFLPRLFSAFMKEWPKGKGNGKEIGQLISQTEQEIGHYCSQSTLV